MQGHPVPHPSHIRAHKPSSYIPHALHPAPSLRQACGSCLSVWAQWLTVGTGLSSDLPL